ncbi:acyltransferase [Spirosoma agri]|uniref:Acyltransferase n=2 Tax=Spirosoma agri TaxID=1987381 RepID=A0A6M0INP3_9BACT|nr:acyltransferase [Spirosoma agri]
MIFSCIRLAFRTLRFVWRRCRRIVGAVITRIIFYLNNVTYGPGLRTYGIPVVDINDGCQLNIGSSFNVNSGRHFNRIGRQQPSFFIADLGGIIQIGDRVGMSSTALVCHHAITIGNDVTIGGNTVIYDTDFHTLDSIQRTNFQDNNLAKTAPVIIRDRVFIGSHVTILKGVTIGEDAVIAAGSVVTRNVPDNQLWGGNPAQLIRSLTAQPAYE